LDGPIRLFDQQTPVAGGRAAAAAYSQHDSTIYVCDRKYAWLPTKKHIHMPEQKFIHIRTVV
jgi:hypothetical protein